ncbi:MAG TPA: FG-GAP-like repeat-containing protein [Bacteroidales bacterium]|nr:FG-GAP-like repeat-containing protein [Bacteroidales bacterium]HPS51115.1 FG-GAP-like repeat-containing protein [Bacteroidales bacterium]
MKKLYSLLLIMAGLSGSFPATSQVLLQEHVIMNDFYGATCISSADFNGDGFVDFVVTGNSGDIIGWFENDGNQNFTEHTVATGFTQAKGIVAAKIDANDSWDFVATSKTPGKFSWFANDGSGNFTEHVITDSTWTSADFVDAADIDRDGDRDLILVACDNNKIAWAENDGTGAFTIRMLKENWIKANWGTAADLDQDGDIDIIATAKAGQIIWFKNDGQQNFSQDTLYDHLDGANSVRVADLDGDGDLDLAGTACGNSDQVAWYENDGNFHFTMHLLRNNYNGSRACELCDLDKDGDMDFLSIAWQGSQISLWENDGKGHFTEQIICNTAYDMIRIHVVDLDLDNDPDILGACYGDQEIRWWENIFTFTKPDFTADSLSGHHVLQVNFHNLTVSRPGIHTWRWDFDNDGITDSQEQHPVWVYNKPGSYTVKLVAISDSLTDSIVKQDYIRVFDRESSLEFNGSSGSMMCTQGSIPDITGSFTLETWIKPTKFGINSSGKIFDKTVISLFTYLSGALVPPDSCLTLIMVHASGIVSVVATPSGSVRLDEWQHIAVSYNDSSSTVKIYINAEEQPLETVTPPDGPLSGNGVKPIVIGNARNGNQGFQGCIDEVRLWEGARTREEIEELMGYDLPPDQKGMYGYWKMNEGAGDTAFDRSENGQKGILKNTRWAQGVHLIPLSIDEKWHGQESGFLKVGIYPNPVHSAARIEVESHETGICSAAIFNSAGVMIRQFPDFLCPAGEKYPFIWNGKDDQNEPARPGLYLLKISLNNQTVTKKLVFLNF